MLKRRMAKQFLQGEKADAALSVLTTAEHELLAAVKRQRDLLGGETVEELPTAEDRAETLRGLWLAMIDGSLPAFWVEHFSGLANADEAAQYADLDDAEWQSQKETWAARYREQGMEGDVDELAAAHVRARHDCDLDEFYHLVVHWPEGRQADTLREVTASGVETAIQQIERTNEELAARLDDAEG